MTGARGSASCVEVRELFPAYVDEALSREERSSVREHLAGCSECRVEASSADPALLFAALEDGGSASADAVSPEEIAKILAGVRAGIAVKTAERRIASGSAVDRERRSWRPAMTAAATVAAVALAWRLAPRRADTPIASRTTPAAVAAAPAQTIVRPASLALESAGSAGTAEILEPAAKTDANTKGNFPADATIYDWSPGGGQPRVVWIVGRSLDI